MATQFNANSKIKPHWYIVPAVTTIAAAATSSSNITFDADSTFTWYKTTYFCDLSGAAITDSTRPIPLITVTLTDTGSSRQYTSIATPIDTIAGRMGSEPLLLPVPLTFSPNSTLRVAYTNYSAATTYTNIFMVLHGIKEYFQ